MLLAGPPVSLAKAIYDSHLVPFVDHGHEDPPWLALTLDFDLARNVLDQLNSTDLPLKSRFEAHITVITPPETSTLALANVTMDQINAIALTHNIQDSKFTIECVGRLVDAQNNLVYALIVTPGTSLVRIREDIFRLYVAQGGEPAWFDPHAFWPHVTIGFTDTDIFDGVYKGVNACAHPLHFI
ncbi:hypothetical protein BC940DRAFT_307152 [Gongronella butleri]|nr:hypothetical protein BC940DRAFT_307152 [Gongronella butleri]